MLLRKPSVHIKVDTNELVLYVYMHLHTNNRNVCACGLIPAWLNALTDADESRTLGACETIVKFDFASVVELVEDNDSCAGKLAESSA